jgi:glycosyltransferase involved in cell wall biosynthesis
VCISQGLARVVAQEWGLDESSMLFEHSGHNFPIRDDYRASSADGRRLRALYVGSFDTGKGIDTIFEVARLHPEIDFVAVGGQVLGAGLPDNVAVRPRVAHADVPNLLSEADILLMPFRTYSGEGLPPDTKDAEEFYSPLKMVEYLSAGRAIVSSDLPSIAEVLVDGRNCLLVNPADSARAWSAAIGRLEHDGVLRERLAHGATQTARRHTTVERARRILDRIEASS